MHLHGGVAARVEDLARHDLGDGSGGHLLQAVGLRGKGTYSIFCECIFSECIFCEWEGNN